MTSQQLLLLLLCWSALAIPLAWLLPARWQLPAIAACGMGFLGCVSPLSLAVLAGGTLASFLVAQRAAAGHPAFLFGTMAIVVTFVAFMAVGGSGSGEIGVGVVLPVGMAFYCLRLIHYLIDGYKGVLRPHGLLDCLAYQFLPGAIPVGPIHRFDDFLRDARRRRWDSQQCSEGLRRVLYGLAKLIVLGNYVVALKLTALLAGSLAATGIEAAYAEAVLFWIKLYVFFSGYSDIAIGFAALTGFRLRENFDWPLLSRNIGEFWQRWHMSLSAWCRDYVFTPALSLTRSHVLAVLASMLVLGLWHELSLRYLLWGAYHGLGIAAHRWFARRTGPFEAGLPRPAQRLWRFLATVLTLHFVLFSFAATRAVERFLLGG